MGTRMRWPWAAAILAVGLWACGDDSGNGANGGAGGTGAVGGTGGSGATGGTGGTGAVGGSGGTGGTGGEGATGGTGGTGGAGATGGTGGSGGDPGTDTDGDGLTDAEEADWGTNPRVKDTDGDGWDDFEEVVTKGFDPNVNAYQFNPLVADVPRLKVDLTSLPDAYVDFQESSGNTRRVEVAYTDSSTNGRTSSWGGSQSQAIEMTHTAGVSMSVEHEFGLFGGTSVGLELSYEFSHSTTNETSVNWSEEQSSEHTRALEEMEGHESTTGTTFTGGKIKTTIRLQNEGDIAYELQNLTLNAYLHNPQDPLNLGSLGTLRYADGTYQDSLDPGEVVTGLNFEASVDLPTIRKLLENSRNLVIQPSGIQMRGLGDIDFTHATTDIGARTAQVVIDYGLHRRQESYRVATIVDQNNPGVTVRQVLQDVLRVPYTVGTGEWLYFGETAPRASGLGITSIRNVAMDSATSSYWIVAHTKKINNGADDETTYYNLVLDGYEIEDLVLDKGSTLHLVFVQDTDRDGLGDRAELVYGTDPTNPDTDGDGASDYLEVGGWMVPDENGVRVFPNPLMPDTDLDGASDWEEYNAVPRTNPVDSVRRAPTVDSISASSSGVSATLDVTFSDADHNDRVTTLFVNWGDGGGVQEIAVNAGETSKQLTHAYASLGAYSITAWVRDSTGLESSVRSAQVTLSVPTNGLVAYWPLNGTAGDMTNTYDATFNTSFWGTDRFGFGGKAANLDYDNNNNLGLIVAPHVPFSTSFTIAAWVYADPMGNTERIVGQGNWFNLYFATSDRVAFGRLDGTQPDPANVRVEAPNTVDGRHVDNVWTLYVGVVEAGVGNSTLRLYKNGVQVASQTFNQTFVNPGTCRFYMGRGPDGNSCTGTQPPEFDRFPGMLDDVRVYGRALTPGEVSLLHAEPDTHNVNP